MNTITPLLFDSGRVRVVLIGGEPHFVGKDACDRLGYADNINAIKQHCRGVVIHHPIVDSLGRQQMARVISEADLMRLIVNSKLPAAEQFERIVFDEILPTIRRTGSYGQPVQEIDMNDSKFVLKLLQAQATKALAETNRADAAEQRVAVLAPQVAALHMIARQEGEFSLRDCAKTLSMPPKAFNYWLISIGWIYRDASDDLRPYQDRIQSGHMRLRRSETTLPSGKIRAITQPLVTAKGQVKLGYLLSLKK